MPVITPRVRGYSEWTRNSRRRPVQRAKEDPVVLRFSALTPRQLLGFHAVLATGATSTRLWCCGESIAGYFSRPFWDAYIEQDIPTKGTRRYPVSGTMESSMGPDEYRRLHAVCLDLADQSNVPDVRLRWLTMAQGWIELANEPPLGQPPRFADSNAIQLGSRQKSGPQFFRCERG